jgi:hypothetical protein
LDIELTILERLRPYVSPDDVAITDVAVLARLIADRADDDTRELVAMIPITKTEAKVLVQLLFNASTDTVVELTADVAESLLEKLRHAHFEERE